MPRSERSRVSQDEEQEKPRYENYDISYLDPRAIDGLSTEEDEVNTPLAEHLLERMESAFPSRFTELKSSAEKFEEHLRKINVEAWKKKVSDQQIKKILQVASQLLTDKQLQVFFLFFICRETEDEIALMQGVTQPMISTALAASVKKIQEALQIEKNEQEGVSFTIKHFFKLTQPERLMEIVNQLIQWLKEICQLSCTGDDLYYRVDGENISGCLSIMYTDVYHEQVTIEVGIDLEGLATLRSGDLKQNIKIKLEELFHA